MSKKVQQGFTLIELMIVIAIIGILAAIAIPQYQDYVVRSKVSEGPNLVAAAKTAVATTFQTLGRFPTAANASYGLPLPASISGQYVTSVEITSGGLTQPTGVQGVSPKIEITYNSTKVGGTVTGNANVLTFEPYVRPGGSVIWVCGNHSVMAGSTQVTGTGTTVPDKYLPANCR